MLIRITGKRPKQIAIFDFDTLNELVQKTVRSFYKRHLPKLNYLAFGEFEDAVQIAWTRLIESVQARDIIIGNISGKEALLVTIMKNGLIDYMRSRIGRDENTHKSKGMFATTYYMDYYRTSDTVIDLPIKDRRYTPENFDRAILVSQLLDDWKEEERKVKIREKMQRDIEQFIRKKKEKQEKRKKRELTDQEKNTLKLMVHWGMDQREIGRSLGLTESRVSQIVKKGIDKLKEKHGDV